MAFHLIGGPADGELTRPPAGDKAKVVFVVHANCRCRYCENYPPDLKRGTQCSFAYRLRTKGRFLYEGPGWG